MLFLTAFSAEAAAAPVSTLNPTQYRIYSYLTPQHVKLSR